MHQRDVSAISTSRGRRRRCWRGPGVANRRIVIPSGWDRPHVSVARQLVDGQWDEHLWHWLNWKVRQQPSQNTGVHPGALLDRQGQVLLWRIAAAIQEEHVDQIPGLCPGKQARQFACAQIGQALHRDTVNRRWWRFEVPSRLEYDIQFGALSTQVQSCTNVMPAIAYYLKHASGRAVTGLGHQTTSTPR